MNLCSEMLYFDDCFIVMSLCFMSVFVVMSRCFNIAGFVMSLWIEMPLGFGIDGVIAAAATASVG